MGVKEIDQKNRGDLVLTYCTVQHRVCDHTFTDTHTQSLYTTRNCTFTGAQTFCTNNTFIYKRCYEVGHSLLP